MAARDPLQTSKEVKIMDSLRSRLRTKRISYPALAVVAAAFLFTGMLIASSLNTGSRVQAGTVQTTAGGGAPQSFADLAEALGPTVVNIRVTKIEKTAGAEMPDLPDGPFGDMFKHFFGDTPQMPRKYKMQGQGSGVVINQDGTILTNNHVVDGANEIIVTLTDKKEHKAKVVGRDPKTDLAVIKMDGKGPFKAAALGDSDAARVGEWVLAIGNPFGLSNTVTSGIVSAKGRVIGAGPYDDFIQTDAPINPGNSGGPLFNMKGEVIAINTAIIPNGQGIGFAIPINTAKTLLPELMSKGKVTRGYLGVNIQNMTEDLASSLNIKATKGVLVADVVSGSPADKAGVKRGDVITMFNGKEIKDSHELSALVAGTPVDKNVPLKIIRDGKDMTLQITTGNLVDSSEPVKSAQKEPAQSKWGMQLQELTPDIARQLGSKVERGVVVSGVKPDSPADEAQIQKGDIILEINKQVVKGIADARQALEKASGKQALLLVQRGGNSIYIVLKGAE
jgi:serine protease Do